MIEFYKSLKVALLNEEYAREFFTALTYHDFEDEMLRRDIVVSGAAKMTCEQMAEIAYENGYVLRVSLVEKDEFIQGMGE
ncbi:hypothetical protein N9137_00800 [Pseudomonadales bacterium]|nr:hypothetical protein [Pseudomonadales bacterium]